MSEEVESKNNGPLFYIYNCDLVDIQVNIAKDKIRLDFGKDGYIELCNNALSFNSVRISPLEPRNKWKRIWYILRNK